MSRWPALEAFGWLAARHWGEPSAILISTEHSRCLARGCRDSKVIGVLCSELTRGGAANTVLCFVRDLLQEGQRAVILVDETPGKKPNKWGNPNDWLYRSSMSKDVLSVVRIPALTGGRYPERVSALEQALHDNKVDVLICDKALESPTVVWDAYVARLIGVPCVYTQPEIVSFDHRGRLDSRTSEKRFMDEARARLATAKHELEDAKAQIATTQGRVGDLERELRDVRGSVSFRAGRALTAPLRALRDALRRGSN